MTNQKTGEITCFNEMGKVRSPHRSGVLTISFVIDRHDRQTEAQATTSLRAGQEVWLASTRWMMSRSNSGGMFAHRLCWTTADEDRNPTGAICDRPRPGKCLLSTPLLAMFPIPSFISLTMLLNVIVNEFKISLSADLFQQNKQRTSSKTKKEKRSQKSKESMKEHRDKVLKDRSGCKL